MLLALEIISCLAALAATVKIVASEYRDVSVQLEMEKAFSQ